MAKGYQSFKQKSTRTTYCSKDKYASHAESAVWVADALKHFGIQASDTMDYQFPLANQPANATIWPA
jgi:hypothetical protein